MAEIKKNIITGKWSYKGSDKIYSKHEEPIKIDKSYNFNHKIMDILQSFENLEGEIIYSDGDASTFKNNKKMVDIFNGLINLTEKNSLDLNSSEMKYLLDTAKRYALDAKSRIELVSLTTKASSIRELKSNWDTIKEILDKKKEIASNEMDSKIENIVSKLPGAPTNGEVPKEKI